MSSDDPTPLPARVGPYELFELIGEGDIGRVYAARNLSVQGFDKRLVIKRLRRELADLPGYHQAFVNEARLAASLSHTNIVHVVEIGEDQGLPYIVMEHVQGMDLARCNEQLRQQGRSWPPQLAIFVAAEVAMGLDHAHRRRDFEGRPLGIVHQDVTPSNVLLSFEGAVKLTDFGMVTATGHERLERVAHPRYLAPEQVRGEAVDPRTDVYNCGLLLYEMVAGRQPFSDLDAEAAVERIGLGAVPVLGDRTRAQLEPNLVEVLSRATAPWPNERYEDAAELYEALMSTIFAAEHQLGRRDLVDLLESLRRTAERTDVVPAEEIERALGSWRSAPQPDEGDELAEEPTRARGPSTPKERSYEQLASDDEETRTAVGTGSASLTNIPQPPLRGRASERRRLAEAVARAARGEREVVEIIAPEGLGKTRLVLEVVGRARSGKAPLGFYSASCAVLPSTGRFTAARAVLRSILGLAEEEDANVAGVGRRLRELGLGQYEREALQDVVGIGPGSAPPGPGRARATARGLAQVLRRLGEEALTIVFFDDAELMDADSARLLPRIARHTKGARVLLVLARRDELSPWPEPVATEIIRPGPLPPGPMAQVITDSFEAMSIEPHIIHQLTGVADGNPRLAGEFARLLREVGAVVVGEDGAARLAQGTSLPSLTLDEIIDRRLDLRSDMERAVLEAAACLGTHFETKLLTAATNLSTDAVAAVLEAAVAARMVVVASPRSCAFAHERIRRRILAPLSPEELGEVHGRIAEVMASVVERRDASWRMRCASHLRLSGQRARARDLLATSAAQLETSGATDAAIDHFSAALELTKGQDEMPVALALALRPTNLALRCGRLREGQRAATLRSISRGPGGPGPRRSKPWCSRGGWRPRRGGSRTLAPGSARPSGWPSGSTTPRPGAGSVAPWASSWFRWGTIAAPWRTLRRRSETGPRPRRSPGSSCWPPCVAADRARRTWPATCLAGWLRPSSGDPTPRSRPGCSWRPRPSTRPRGSSTGRSPHSRTAASWPEPTGSITTTPWPRTTSGAPCSPAASRSGPSPRSGTRTSCRASTGSNG